MAAQYEKQFGRGVPERLAGWRDFVKGAKAAASAEDVRAGALAPVNRFYNRVPSFTDPQHWKTEDYWATPAETLASNGADCEDYAIAKYFALQELGVPMTQLRLVYVRSELARGAHMVLAWYATPGADPLILDNLEGGIRPAKDRSDLVPVYSFNDNDMEVVQANAPAVKLAPGSNRKWAVVLQKLQREQAN